MSTKTKEEILSSYYPDFDKELNWMFDGPVDQVFKAMDEWAKIQSIEFALHICGQLKCNPENKLTRESRWSQYSRWHSARI